MKLYTFDLAPNPQRLNLFMQYKGIELETVQVDMAAQEQLGDDYKAVNPLGTVPALVTDEGAVLTEIVGACLYLEALYPDKPLMGTSDLEKALVVSKMHQLFNTAFMAVAEAFRNSTPGFKGRALPGPLDLEQIPELAERGKFRLGHYWDDLDAQLGKSDWLVGDSITQADIDLMVCQSFSGWIKANPGESHGNLLAHTQRVQAALAG